MTWAARAWRIMRPELKPGSSSEWDGVEKLEMNKLDPDVGNGRQQEVAADEDVEQFNEAAPPAAEFADSPARGGREGRGGRRVGVSVRVTRPVAVRCVVTKGVL